MIFFYYMYHLFVASDVVLCVEQLLSMFFHYRIIEDGNRKWQPSPCSMMAANLNHGCDVVVGPREEVG